MENKECRKLKVLCLHGHYGNATVMQYQLAYFEEVFRDYIEFEYLTAPHLLTQVYDQRVYDKFNGIPFYTWIYKNEKTDQWEGIYDSYDSIKQYMDDNGPFDGLIGFSQGGYLSRMIIKCDEIGFPAPTHRPNFGIIISSPITNNILPELTRVYSVPMMYIYGKNDTITTENAAVKEGDFAMIEHEQGHNIPKFIDEEMDVFIQFVNKAYETKFGEAMQFEFPIDAKFKAAFIEHQKFVTQNPKSLNLSKL